jgi:NAD(P)-dependent dehydrogenase (short-subunit alcohol dehydrogenase family)
VSAALVAGLVRTIGPGYEAALRLAEEGHHVVVSAPERAAAEIVAARLRAHGFPASPIRLDPRDVEALPVVAAELSARFGGAWQLVDGSDDGEARELIDALRPLLEAEPIAV